MKKAVDGLVFNSCEAGINFDFRSDDDLHFLGPHIEINIAFSAGAKSTFTTKLLSPKQNKSHTPKNHL